MISSTPLGEMASDESTRRLRHWTLSSASSTTKRSSSFPILLGSNRAPNNTVRTTGSYLSSDTTKTASDEENFCWNVKKASPDFSFYKPFRPLFHLLRICGIVQFTYSEQRFRYRPFSVVLGLFALLLLCTINIFLCWYCLLSYIQMRERGVGLLAALNQTRTAGIQEALAMVTFWLVVRRKRFMKLLNTGVKIYNQLEQVLDLEGIQRYQRRTGWIMAALLLIQCSVWLIRPLTESLSQGLYLPLSIFLSFMTALMTTTRLYVCYVFGFFTLFVKRVITEIRNALAKLSATRDNISGLRDLADVTQTFLFFAQDLVSLFTGMLVTQTIVYGINFTLHLYILSTLEDYSGGRDVSYLHHMSSVAPGLLLTFQSMFLPCEVMQRLRNELQNIQRELTRFENSEDEEVEKEVRYGLT